MREKLLRITTPHFVAGVVFRKMPLGMWKPVKAAPILGWMMAHEDHIGIAAYLNGPAKRKGWIYEWI